jgi:U3 small nucleolar RNA-associated protein 5
MSTKRKLATKLGQPALKPSAKLPGTSAVDDSRTVVIDAGKTGNGVVEASDSSSVEEDEEEDISEQEDEAEDEELEQEEGESPIEAADISMDDAPEEDEEGESAEPSFGELVRGHVSEPIDVAGAFDAPSPGDQAYTKAVQVPAAPSGASLGTVLAQALRTNDVALLESCLHTTDTNTIRATIQRLDSPLAGSLLQKLAERLHRRPGRAGSLMVWVQWTLVTHGGYLATQRDLVKKLAELNRVIDERARGLQSLLSLKGKLDMLEAQIELRRTMQGQRGDEDEDDEDVIYVEGQESEEEEEVDGETVRKPKRLAQNGDLEDISDGQSEESDDMPLTNGKLGESEDEDSESSEDDDADDLIDDEAEETDNDEADENEVDHDDQDEEVEDEESDDAGAPPPKMQRTGLSSRRR